MAITRTAIVDDDGTGTTGTVIDNAWKQELYDQIDGVATGGVAAVVPVSVTGSQIVTITTNTRVVRCTNATLLTITALSPTTFDGHAITIYAAGAGQVDILDGIGATGGILIGIAAASTTRLSLAPGTAAAPFHNGRMTVVYDATLQRWRVVAHEQGAWLPYTPVWGNLGTANTLGNGTITGAYHLAGRTCRFRLSHTWGSTTAGGSSAFTYAFPFTPNAGAAIMPFPLLVQDASVGAQVGTGEAFVSNVAVFFGYNIAAPNAFTAAAPFTWAVGDRLDACGMIEL